MQGKDYTVTVQAINRDQKMSLVSEPAVFSVADSHPRRSRAGESKVLKESKEKRIEEQNK